MANLGRLRRGRGRVSRPVLLGLFASLLCALAWAAAPAVAAAPDATIGTATNPTYTTVHVEGSVDAHGEPTGWGYEVSDDGGASWQGTNLGNYTESAGPEAADGDIEYLTAGKTYQVRLAATNYNDGSQGFSAEPNPEFTTDSIPAPTVTIDPVSGATGTSAHLTGRIEPNPPAGDPSAADVGWHFQCNPECPNLAGGTVPATATGAEQEVEVEAAGLEPNTEYTVSLVGKNAGEAVTAGPITFRTSEVEPEVQTLPAFAIRGGTEALVGGSINPRNSETTYWVEWGRTTSYGQKIPATPADAGSGGQLEYFTERLTGLTPSTVYHARLAAENSANGDGPSRGADQSFETAPAEPEPAQSCPNEQLRRENDSNRLPDCRAYEQVSPTDKNGFAIGPPTNLDGYVAAADGSGVTFESLGAFGDSRSSSLINPFLSRRTASGWTTHALAPPFPSRGNEQTTMQWYSKDLSKAVIVPPRGYSLAPGDAPGQLNIYLRDNATDSYTTLDSAGMAGGGNFVGARQDGERVYFSSGDPLLPEAPSGGFSSIYEWQEGHLSLASVRPDGEPLPEGASTSTASGVRLVSEDGSRLMFKGGNAADQSLYLRESGQTYLIAPNAEGNDLLGATPDLSSIFFCSTAVLAPGAQAESVNLYRFNADAKTVSLIAPGTPGGGNVSAVVGVSDNGSYVYFRSGAQYLPGQGLKGHTGFEETNLYLWHDGEITFIAAEQHPELVRDILNRYRLSPDGKELSFQSVDRLTSYDNTDAEPGPGNQPRADTEVYVYDAAVNRLTCVSCNPSGASPSGTAEGPAASSSFPVPPPRQTQNPQPGVRDDGSIFFESRDALVPGDVNGVNDVYEWRDGRVHLISTGTDARPSFLGSSSTSGDDVFFTTVQQLVPADRDELADLYDARVDGGFTPSSGRTICEGIEGCHGSGSSPPPERTASSAALAPQAKIDTRRLRLKRQLKACRHKPKKMRAKCRARAKKRYRTASKKGAH